MKNKYQSCFLHKYFAFCPISRLFTVLVIFQGESPESIIVQYVYDFTLYKQRQSAAGSSFFTLSTYASMMQRNWHSFLYHTYLGQAFVRETLAGADALLLRQFVNIYATFAMKLLLCPYSCNCKQSPYPVFTPAGEIPCSLYSIIT